MFNINLNSKIEIFPQATDFLGQIIQIFVPYFRKKYTTNFSDFEFRTQAWNQTKNSIIFRIK